MRTWEYKIIDSNAYKKPGLMRNFTPADVDGFLNKYGQEGWELIHFQCKFKTKEIESFYGLAKREVVKQAQNPSPEQE
ncbi:DUF4177 domain-containing protein [bacterium]